MKTLRTIPVVAVLLFVVSVGSAQIAVESGSGGNLLTVLFFNSDDLIELDATVEYTSLPSFVSWWSAELDRVLPDPTPPLTFGNAQFVFDVDSVTPPGAVEDLWLDVVRGEADTTAVAISVSLVAASPLASAVRVVFQADMTDTGALVGDSVEAILEDGTVVVLNDTGSAPDTGAGDGTWSGGHVFGIGSVAQHRYELFRNASAECDSALAPEQRIFRVEDLLFDDALNPQILPVAEFGLCTVVAVDPGVGVQPSRASLRSNRPNPFNATTTFSWSQSRAARVSLLLYDARGRRVAQPVAERDFPAGTHSLPWDARTLEGRSMAAGIYYLRLVVDGQPQDTRNIVLVR